jgi:DNA primase
MSDIDEVKSRIDIVDYIGKKVTLKKAGKNFKGLCPFHGEKTPSFMVSPDRQSWHCFGCGKGGSVIDFVMEYDHVDFREALEDLADQAGVTLQTQQSGSTSSLKETLLEIHHLAAEYYHYLLTAHAVGATARAYLEQRGVSEKIIETFRLGYSANSWEGLSKYLKKKGFDEKMLETSGLLIASAKGGYDRFRGRLMFPLRDSRGRTIAFAGRVLAPDVKEAKYINSPETPLYIKGNTVFALDITKSAIQKEQEVVLMEGEFDVLSSYQAGISNVVAIKGTALTEAQIHLLKRYAKKIVFALDSDVAGDSAARRGIDLAHKFGLELYVAQMPLGKDPDDVARTAPHLLKQAIKEALPLYDYYLTSLQKKHDLSQAYGKKSFTEELLPLLAEIDNQVVQSHYLKKVADLLDLSESTVVTTMQKTLKKKQLKTTKVAEEVVSATEDKQELLLLALILQGEMFPEIDSAMIQSQAIRSILGAVLTAKSVKQLGTFPSEYTQIIDTALLWDLSGITDDDKTLQRMLQQTLKEIKKKYLRQKLNELTSSLEEEPSLQETIQAIAKELRLLEK